MTTTADQPETPGIDPAVLPAGLARRLAGYDWEGVDIGCSSADVFLLRAAGRPNVVLKSEIAGAFSELPAEVERLSWLRREGLASPTPIVFETGGGRHFLLMSALSGSDLARADDIPVLARVEFAASALRTLHAQPVAGCPFDHRLENRLRLAEARMRAGLVDEDDFDDDNRDAGAQELFAWLTANRPQETDIVVTHGDASMPNFMATAEGFSGYIDCGRLGVADRYQDIAIAVSSIQSNFGAEAVAGFLKSYGLSAPDAARMRYYRTLDEFF
ncbi:APH(3') family aminoglycoside O-phosphotransferase [Martelella sp. AD-3]|uniref:APH(3') family aminoglycoside O-phosphotransferase n=1 Tax=Martelella sp. AD-3 TaxID=686597 RepID=UPI0004B42EF0|nr:APH(3') family aminoglycoside O-phosphotransferase [Martelella sp. AD-3]AMM86376.1 hypothetical protein AZF01_20235 [Martelella sp. AD-3]